MTEPESIQQLGRTYARYEGKTLSYFSGCDYFRLGSDSRILAAASEAAQKYGVNVAASRLTSGNHILYQKLEWSLTEFFRAPSALLVPNGYVTNLIVAQALEGNFSHALVDELAHPSLLDAARLLDCPVLQFSHCDTEAVSKTVQRCGPGAKFLVLTDGMFSKDGAAAPLADYVRVLPKDSWLLVDDAHGAGVLGTSGKGSLEYAGISDRRVIHTITLSKAFGSFGGAIMGPTTLRRAIVQRSRMFAGSTPVPLPLAAMAIAALNILKKEGKILRERLHANTTYLRRNLRKNGLEVDDTAGPIVSVVPKSKREAAEFSSELLRARIYPPLMHYPGVPPPGCFRFSISSEHERSQLDHLIRAITKFFSGKRAGRGPSSVPARNGVI